MKFCVSIWFIDDLAEHFLLLANGRMSKMKIIIRAKYFLLPSCSALDFSIRVSLMLRCELFLSLLSVFVCFLVSFHIFLATALKSTSTFNKKHFFPLFFTPSIRWNEWRKVKTYFPSRYGGASCVDSDAVSVPPQMH